MQLTATNYCGRFAPSPSGPLHFGSLVAALGSYLDARSAGGLWLLRIEDLDLPRVRTGAADEILRTLDAFGFQWDGEILYQSRRNSAYRQALLQLQRERLTYPCSCTRAEIAAAGLSGLEGPLYPGYCRHGLAHQRPNQATRLRTDDRPISFHDQLFGEQLQHLSSSIGDFVIHRADGLFAYQLAVVVDDAFQGINHVIRGADLLTSTPRQLYLQQLLGLPASSYGHLPLVLDPQGRKLSKQHQAHPVSREEPLAALVDALSFLNQPLPDRPLADLDEFWEWSVAHWNILRLQPVSRPSRPAG